MSLRSTVLSIGLAFAATLAIAEDKVVYHITDTAAQALAALRNIKNQLDVEPGTRIIVVSNGNGIDFMLQDAKDRNGNPYDIAVQDLIAKGVKFEVCEITLKSRDLKRKALIDEAELTPSGVVRVTKLQAAGYAYIKP